MTKFELVLVKPVAGQPGKKVCDITRFADTISEAIKACREDIGLSPRNDKGEFIVLQRNSYTQAVKAARELALA